MGLGVKLLVILTHMGPNGTWHMHTHHLLTVVPTEAHLPKIRLCYSGLTNVVPKKGVTFIIVGQTTATCDLRIKADLTLTE